MCDSRIMVRRGFPATTQPLQIIATTPVRYRIIIARYDYEWAWGVWHIIECPRNQYRLQDLCGWLPSSSVVFHLESCKSDRFVAQAAMLIR